MLDVIIAAVGDLLGVGSEEQVLGQVLLRAIVVYLGALVLVRMGEKRFLGKSTAFDTVLGVMLGSVVSRGITGSAPLLESLGAGAVLVGLHWLAATLTFRSDRLGNLIKGTERVLVRDGEIQWREMGKSNITRQDLLSGLRGAAQVDDPAKVKIAYLERSGDISALKKKGQPRVVDIKVADGVQTVRLEIPS